MGYIFVTVGLFSEAQQAIQHERILDSTERSFRLPVERELAYTSCGP